MRRRPPLRCEPVSARLATWHFLTSNLTTLNAVWRAYGVSVNVSRTSGIVAHNDVMYFVDPSGRLRYEATPFADESSSGAFSLPSASIDRWGQGIASLRPSVAREHPVSGVSGPATTERRFPPIPEPDGGTRRWYKRRAFLVAAGVVVVVGAAVISDLPTPTSPASDAKAENAVIKQINTDVAPCLFSIREALTLYGDETSGTLSSAHRAQIPALLRDDQTACSYTNDNIFELSDIDVPGSSAGKQVSQAVNTVTVWATSDALGAIEAIQTLTSHPGDRKARRQLQPQRASSHRGPQQGNSRDRRCGPRPGDQVGDTRRLHRVTSRRPWLCDFVVEYRGDRRVDANLARAQGDRRLPSGRSATEGGASLRRRSRTSR